MNHQYEICLPAGHPAPRRRDDADRLRERLAEAVELANAEGDAAERCKLFLAVRGLRERLRDAVDAEIGRAS